MPLNPEISKLASQYRISGMFTGFLESLSDREEDYVSKIKKAVLDQPIASLNYGKIWSRVQGTIYKGVINCDPRVFKHVGVLDYKSFTIDRVGVTQDQAESEVRRILATHEFLGSAVANDCNYYLSFGLNRRRFRFKDNVFGDEACQFEELCFIRSSLGRFPKTVLEIGCGYGKLTQMLVERGAKVVVVDFPGMWAINAFSLMCAGKRVGFGDQAMENMRDFDVVFVGPGSLQDYTLFKNFPIRFDLAVCVHALGEMTKEHATDYLQFIKENAEAFFTCGYGIANSIPEKIPEILGWKTVAARYAFYDAWTHPEPKDVMALFER